ncbi:Colicin V production, CvpA [Candidatus Nanopelagicaceae bacterium]
MIFDLIFSLIALGALFTGYKNGLVTTILRTAFFIAGAIAAMYFVVQYNKTGWLIVAIITGAYAAAWVGTQIAKTLKFTLIRGPLRWIDSLLGAIFEVGKYVILFYVIGTILLWAPWSSGQNAVAESKVYLQIDKRAPAVMTELRQRVEKLLSNPHPD